MLALCIFGVCAAAYLLGCFNGAIVISKYILRDDVRKHGSGNAGITNFYRTFGGPLTLMVLLCDVLKVVAAVLPARMILAPFGLYLESAYIAGLFVMLGHVFPVFFRFKGGKGALSAAAYIALVDPPVCAMVLGIFFLTILVTRFVSLGSILAAASFPFLTYLFVHPGPLYVFMASLSALLVIGMHHENIGRLLRGEERRFSFRRRKG